MRKIDQKQRNGGGGRFRSISSYLKIVSSGASTVASSVRSAASAASTIVDRDADASSDQVLWAGFDKLECEGGISRRVLLLGYQSGFQVWDVEDANSVRNLVSRYDGAVSFLQILPKPNVSNHSRVEYPNDHPLLVLCADGLFSAGGNARGGPTVSINGNIKNNIDQINGGYVPTVVWFYSLKSQSYIKELKFRSVVYSVRCSSRIVAVLQAAQVHCFDVATLEREYTILTNPISTTSLRFENIGLGPLAMGPRWIAYSGSMVSSPNPCVSPQNLTDSKILTDSDSSGSIVAHYAKQSSKQLAVGIVTLGDIGYKKLSRYYSEFLPDSNISQQLSDPSRLPDVENVGMVIVRDVVSKSVITQFKAHDSPIASLCFDPSGTLLVTASVHGHSFNVFRIIPGPANGTSYLHLYRLQRGFTNAVIQDISFSVDSRWITISSSRGTSHLFAICPSGGPVNMQTVEELLTTTSQDYTYNAANKPPVTLSAVSRIRNGNNGWRNVLNGAAMAASGRMSSCSGVIASTFHKCKGNNLDPGPGAGPRLSKYYMLVFSSSGCVIQYALRVSSEVDTVYESSLPDNISKLIVEPIQKWNICNKQNRRDHEEVIDIYSENGHLDSRKVFPEKTGNENINYFDGVSKIKKEIINLEEKNHVYISEVELQMHQLQTPLWAKPQISFQSLMIDDINCDEDKNVKGEFEIEKISTHEVEARSRCLVHAVDYVQGPKVQITRTYFDTNGGIENGDEETGEDAAGIKDTDSFVNSDGCPISHSLPETVDNREHSVSGTQSELVNNNIGQKLENHFEDQGAEFD